MKVKFVIEILMNYPTLTWNEKLQLGYHKCHVEDCPELHYAKGLCRLHYEQRLRESNWQSKTT